MALPPLDQADPKHDTDVPRRRDDDMHVSWIQAGKTGFNNPKPWPRAPAPSAKWSFPYPPWANPRCVEHLPWQKDALRRIARTAEHQKGRDRKASKQ